jgi:RNA polymerase sigma factor (sigma-70 family)
MDEARGRKLLRAARRGDRGARARLVEQHLPLVRALASRYRDLGLPFDDLVQEGSIGLLHAIDHYNSSRGAFEPYARFQVRRAIRNALTDRARLIRLPKQVADRRRWLDRTEARLIAAGKRPTPIDLAAATGLSVATVLEARSAAQAQVSLDAPLADGSSLESFVADMHAADPAAETIRSDDSARVRRALERLPERERYVVSEQFGLPGATTGSPRELAHALELSPRRTQTIGHEALETLRRELDSPTRKEER